MKIIHPTRRCPRCNEFNLRMTYTLYGVRKLYFLACVTPGCWFLGPAARTKIGAIRRWKEEVLNDEDHPVRR